MSMYESTLEDSVNFDSARENSNQRNPGIKTLVGSVTLIALGLPAWLASTFSASIAGISGSALVPIVGWALCAAIIIALTIVIIINWDLICAKFNAIVSFFVDAAIDFAEEILNLFGEIRQQAYESTLSNSIADAKCQYGSGKWTDDQLKNALNEALYFGFARVTTKELSNKNSRLHVYLGKYEDGYVIKGATNSGVYFNMSTTRWTYYESTLNYTMWVLNAAFLNFVMALNCDFRLCSTPSLFYNKTTKMTLGDSYYAKELKHINIFGYNWYSDVPIVIADRW